MKYEVLMNVASGLYIVCYIPELYANYKNKNANLWNLPEKVFILIGTTLAFAYALINDDTALIINYGPIFGLDFVAFCMRAYYAWKNHQAHGYIEQKDPTRRAPI
jgi:uncharacterized protein with PQ loop repeat